MLNSVSLVGMALLIFYTGYGMSSWPFSLIGGSSTVHNEVRSLGVQISSIQNRLQNLQEEGGTRNEFEQEEITRLEREERMLDRQRHELEQVAKSCTNRFLLFLRPFQFMFGIFFALLGLLIFVSILLTNIDKAIHCKDAKSGYVLKNGTLPNPTGLLSEHYDKSGVLYLIDVSYRYAFSLCPSGFSFGLHNLHWNCPLLRHQFRVWRQAGQYNYIRHIMISLMK